MHFGDTQTCESHGVHLPSNQWVIEVSNRDFAGTDLAVVGNSNWDSCLLACKAWPNGACEFVVLINGNMCVLKKDLGDGPNGSNVYYQGLRIGIVWQRVPPTRAQALWADGPADAGDGGTVLPLSQNAQQWVLQHGAPGAPNIVVCQLACLKNKLCTHILYNDMFCWLMNRFGPNWNFNFVPGQSVFDLFLNNLINAPTNTLVNMARWTDFDMP